MAVTRMATVRRWLLGFLLLGGIVIVYLNWLHVNVTTVALTLLLYVLLVAARGGLRLATAVSLVAAAAYNFYFLPPIGTFTISDPQNWIALATFLITSIIGSQLSEKARSEARQARARQREVEMLFLLSADILQTDQLSTLVVALPHILLSVVGARSVAIFLLDADSLHLAGDIPPDDLDLEQLRQSSLTLELPETIRESRTLIPVRNGNRPCGLLIFDGPVFSDETLLALGRLISVSLEHATALEQMAASEARKNAEQLRSLILDSITHELRTPLTAIKGATGTLLEAADLSRDDQRELLSIMDEGCDRLDRLLDQAVEMARIETRNVQMNLSLIPLRELVEEACDICEWVNLEHPIEVQLDGQPRIHADLEMMIKVLCNLIENAAKYSAAQSPIRITGGQRNEKIFFSVADHGIGIYPDEKERIFERMYRSKRQNATTPGTGMGLAISRAIVEAHQGTISVSSQPGQGSVFTVLLPAPPSG